MRESFEIKKWQIDLMLIHFENLGLKSIEDIKKYFEKEDDETVVVGYGHVNDEKVVIPSFPDSDQNINQSLFI